MTRLPLAFRVSPMTSRAVRRQAAQSGVDPTDAAAMGALVGALVVEGLPVVVAELLGSGLDDPSDAQRPGLNPGRADDFCQDAEAMVPGRGTEPASGDDGRAR